MSDRDRARLRSTLARSEEWVWSECCPRCWDQFRFNSAFNFCPKWGPTREYCISGFKLYSQFAWIAISPPFQQNCNCIEVILYQSGNNSASHFLYSAPRSFGVGSSAAVALAAVATVVDPALALLHFSFRFVSYLYLLSLSHNSEVEIRWHRVGCWRCCTRIMAERFRTIPFTKAYFSLCRCFGTFLRFSFFSSMNYYYCIFISGESLRE